jgi:hypothetical protein
VKRSVLLLLRRHSHVALLLVLLLPAMRWQRRLAGGGTVCKCFMYHRDKSWVLFVLLCCMYGVGAVLSNQTQYVLRVYVTAVVCSSSSSSSSSGGELLRGCACVELSI